MGPAAKGRAQLTVCEHCRKSLKYVYTGTYNTPVCAFVNTVASLLKGAKTEAATASNTVHYAQGAKGGKGGRKKNKVWMRGSTFGQRLILGFRSP